MPDIDIAVGEFSRRAGCNIETIRYYERIGLLPKPRREKGGRFRRYDRDDVARLRFIRGHGSLAFRWTRFVRCCGLLVVMARTCGPRHGASLPSTSQASARRLPTSKRWNAF